MSASGIEALDQCAERYPNLLDQRLGGRAIAASDQWFAPCSNLVQPGRGEFRAGHFVTTGQWMDGWESRRSFRRAARSGDYDWCILRLGCTGALRGFDVDTNHFRGNAPDHIALEGALLDGDPDASTRWTPLVAKSPCAAHSQNYYPCDAEGVFSHLRLRIYPDGGVARLRAYGEPRVQSSAFVPGELVDLAAAAHGGRGIAASNRFYSSPHNLLMPGRGINMGDGWETRRRRDAGHDWAIIRLGLRGSIRKVVVDTANFWGNYPDHMTLEGALTDDDAAQAERAPWQPLLSEQRLCPDREHVFIGQLLHDAQAHFSHVRLNIYPDGGVSRLRVLGFPQWPDD